MSTTYKKTRLSVTESLEDTEKPIISLRTGLRDGLL